MPSGSVVDQQYWFDDSARVPCTEPHTTETVMAFSLPEPTIAEAEKALNFCDRHVRSYLGVDPKSWVPWSPVAFLPSEEEVAAGASWVRCDAFFQATTHRSSARTTNVSAKGIADAPPADYWACTEKPPDGADQPYVPCDRPHNYEQTGSLAILTSITEYPSAAERSAEAQRQCRDGVPAGYDDVTVDAVWDPRSSFEEGTELAAGASCSTPMGGRSLPGRSSMMVGLRPQCSMVGCPTIGMTVSGMIGRPPVSGESQPEAYRPRHLGNCQGCGPSSGDPVRSQTSRNTSARAGSCHRSSSPTSKPVRHRSTASMPARRRPRSALEVLDGAKHQVSVRQWRSWPQQLKHPGSSAELGQARREVGHHGRFEEERWGPESVLAVPPHDPGERQRRRDHVLDRGRVHRVILAGSAAGALTRNDRETAEVHDATRGFTRTRVHRCASGQRHGGAVLGFSR